jgi:hypothetical protein
MMTAKETINTRHQTKNTQNPKTERSPKKSQPIKQKGVCWGSGTGNQWRAKETQKQVTNNSL